MRRKRSDPYLDRMRESLSVPGQTRATRIKLFGSIAVLATVMVIAVFWQFQRHRVAVRVESEQPSSVATPGRTVFGESGERSRTADSDQGISPGTGVPSDIQAFLGRWRTTLISGDAAAQAALYAPRVDRFFTKRNVTRQDVLREKQRMLSRYPEFHKYDIREVRVESLDADRAVVTFRKDWDARGRGRFAGSEQQRLTLSKRSGSWQIVREEETKVHWVRRS